MKIIKIYGIFRLDTVAYVTKTINIWLYLSFTSCKSWNYSMYNSMIFIFCYYLVSFYEHFWNNIKYKQCLVMCSCARRSFCLKRRILISSESENENSNIVPHKHNNICQPFHITFEEAVDLLKVLLYFSFNLSVCLSFLLALFLTAFFHLAILICLSL